MPYKPRDLAEELGFTPDGLKSPEPSVGQSAVSQAGTGVGASPGKCSVCWKRKAGLGLFRMCVQCFNRTSGKSSRRLDKERAKGRI